MVFKYEFNPTLWHKYFFKSKPLKIQIGHFLGHASMGAMSDSFYEYLLKVWLYKSKRDPQVLKMYLDAMEAIKNKLVRKSKSGLVYLSNYPSYDNSVKSMDHLACFAGGMFALTAMQVPMTQAQRREYEILAEEITKTCRLSYTNTITKLGPGWIPFFYSLINSMKLIYV